MCMNMWSIAMLFLELGRIYQQAREEQLARAKAEAMTQ